jgi:N-acetylglucosaminyl-diphospho-decaprenol L-rhamnosyltransferase
MKSCTQDPSDIAIIIVNWNTCALLEECLHSVAADLEASGLESAEVIVVDNGSTDGSVEMIRSGHPWVRVLVNEANVGFARANNQAFRFQPSDFYLLLNSDARLLPGTTARLLAELKSSEQVAVVGAALVNEDYTFQASFSRYPTVGSLIAQLLGLAPLLYGRHFPSAPLVGSLKARDVDWVGGACMMIRREAIEDIGPLDEGYFMYVEDVDWCWRMRQAQWRVRYTPFAVAIHLGGASAAISKPWVMARQWRALLRFMNKHRGPRQAQVVRLAVATLGLLRAWLYLALALFGGQQRSQLVAASRANLNLALLRTETPF